MKAASLVIASLPALSIGIHPMSHNGLSGKPSRRSARRFPTIEAFMRLGGPTRVIAHRGFSGRAPENTLSAFRLAIEAGADMFELDVALSSDGALVVIHDDTLDRTTDGGGRVADADYSELRRLDAGSWFSRDFAGEPIPSLEEVLELADGAILVNVEIKTEAVTEDLENGVVAKVLELIARMSMEDQVVLSSFDPRALSQAKELAPHVRTASLFNREQHEGMSPTEIMAAVGSDGFNTSRQAIDREQVAICHRSGKPVAVYTVNEPDEMARLIDMRVDAIFTDHPDRLLELRR